MFILPQGFREVLVIEDGELIHGHFPVMCGTAPIGGDVA